MSQLKTARVANEVNSTRAGHLILLMDDVLQHCRKWMNEHIALHSLGTHPIGLDDLYRYVAVLLTSHLTGLSFEKTVDLFTRLNCNPPSTHRVRFISRNNLAHSATGRGRGESAWSAQRDETQYLDAFEKAAYEMTRKIFLSPVHTFATLDDDLYGTRARDNQVKTLSMRKADREGHAADAIADALFCVTIAVRFRRRGEPQSTNVLELICTLIEGRGEQCLHGLVIKADRGYGSESLIRTLLQHGIGSILVMSQHLLRCPPFVGKSFISVNRQDEEEGDSDPGQASEEDVLESAVLAFDTHETASAHARGTSSDGAGQLAQVTLQDIGPGQSSSQDEMDGINGIGARRIELDRRRKFVIDDHPEAGPASFFAIKSVKPSSRGHSSSRTPGRSEVTAVAVRENGTKHFSKVLRFFYCVPTAIARTIETWVAVPRTEPVSHMLFSNRDDEGLIVTPSPSSSSDKDMVEHLLLQRCSVLAVGQRCADWFVLRQFRLTGTSAGTILLTDSTVRECVGLPQRQGFDEITLSERLKSLSQTWFGASRSTEAMKRGSMNERGVFAALSSKPFVQAVYECGMLSRADADWMACSPDGIALIDTGQLGISEDVAAHSWMDLASVEIKTNVGVSSLDRAIGMETVDVKTCRVGDAT
ncbi:unnamed protein product [Chondrus crispus]|uniref:Uncharacterized protein n=1 Tax=Chondrus crispus TaxID=2769 RepID=R7QG12_CHOCR|nr:unnamed protein product [Chondrus crispus]CDF37457.1 unnamed protein product [Chondrus crispus]|eukprot:XP_005717276.1 unnamed protein product [Chondrus crispus]